MIFINGVWGKRKWADLSSLEQSAIRRNAEAMRARLQFSPPPMPTLKAQLQGLDLPTLIVTGENSVPLHKMMDDELARCIPKARQVTIPKAGHTSAHDNPAVFYDELLAFWATLKH
jgi:pimeloyl-ACP methyl ester carboxylesterase